MHVLFVEPSFPNNQREFVRALHAVGAKVIGVGEIPVDSVPSETKGWLHHYEQVRSVVHIPSMMEAVQKLQKHVRIDRLEASVEAHMMGAAKVREACGIPGTSVRTTYLCRDKPAMKEALRQAGVPCAASIGTDDATEVRDFAKSEGYPLIIKPRDAAGAAGTWKVSDDDSLEHAIRESGVGRGRSVAVEEFIEGHEGFFDTITIDGHIAHSFITHYYPNVLEAMRTRWISPQFITTNRLDAEGYDEVKEMGRKVIEVLGIETSATHMEWFYGPKGLRFSEIGCRPPGVGAWDLYCNAHDMDVYKEWAMAVVHGRTSQKQSRRFSAGLINLRPDRDGHISGYDNLDLLEEIEPLLIDYRLPPVGAPTQPVEAGYMANAWIRVKHPDYDRLRAILDKIGQTIKVRAR